MAALSIAVLVSIKALIMTRVGALGAEISKRLATLRAALL
jgi:hypothetical protein